MELLLLDPTDITVGDRLRGLDRVAVERLKESIARIGIRTPISVRLLSEEEGWVLVAGRHRLQACLELGLAEVPVREETGTELDARMWEIAENLHRAELTALERDQHIAEWIRLEAERDVERISAQVAPKIAKDGSSRGRPEAGINAAARELKIERTEAQRAVKVDALPQEVKEEAKVLHLDNNRSALLNAAKQPTKEQQLRALRKHAAKRADRKSDVSASERRVEAAVRATKKLSQEELDVFDDWYRAYREDGGAVFDNTRAGARA